ncbi:MAG: TIGR02757 family protein [Thermodesulfobacteriota bacterium]
MRELKSALDRLYGTFDAVFLSPDPIEYVHRFTDPRDQEIAGLIASSLAYGRVDQIKKSIERVMEIMEWSPYAFTKAFMPERDGKVFDGFVHRFNTGKDIACLVSFARQMIEGSGSIGGFFMRGVGPGEGTIRGALARFSAAALALNSAQIYGKRPLPEKAGVRFFFPSPKNGSPCKRLNLYLRWMVRRGDELDFGLWRGIDPATLIIPLDTHVARISRNIGLTIRRSADWRMAEEITANLARLDPHDPVKYDFALCRLGILDHCPKRRNPARCRTCLIRELCLL